LARLAIAVPDSFWIDIDQARELIKQYKDNDAIVPLEKAKKEIFPDPAAYRLLAYVYERNNRVTKFRKASANFLMISAC
jgi:predicted Zn-dependent protease